LAGFVMKSTSGTSRLSTDSTLSFTHTFSIREPDTISFNLSDSNGLQNQNPFRFVVDPREDEFPYVELLQPSDSFEAVQPTVIDLLFRPSDDFELTRAVLGYELQKAFVDEPVSGTIPLEKPKNGVLQTHQWQLATLNLKPKDKLTFWVEVT